MHPNLSREAHRSTPFTFVQYRGCAMHIVHATTRWHRFQIHLTAWVNWYILSLDWFCIRIYGHLCRMAENCISKLASYFEMSFLCTMHNADARTHLRPSWSGREKSGRAGQDIPRAAAGIPGQGRLDLSHPHSLPDAPCRTVSRS